MTATHLQRVSEKVRDLLIRKDAAGQPVYTPEQIRDAFALLVMTQKFPPEALSSDVKALLAQFAVKLGFVGPKATPEDLPGLLERYLQAHPLPQDLTRELREALAAT